MENQKNYEIIAFQRQRKEKRQWKTRKIAKSLPSRGCGRKEGNGKYETVGNHCLPEAEEGKKAMENQKNY